LSAAEQQADKILQHYPQARAFLEQTLEQEAITKIARNQQLQLEVKQKIEQYNQAISEINNCLRSLQLSEHQLPAIGDRELIDEVNNSATQKADCLTKVSES
ncbi:MAG: hypothetical protein WBM86_19780, partial [Waterburya sp.]